MTKPAEVMLHLHQSPGNLGTVDHIEEVYLSHLPKSGDVLRIVLPGDRKTSDYFVTEVRHEFVLAIGGTYRQAQIEITAHRKVT